jgi:hypothetical protein
VRDPKDGVLDASVVVLVKSVGEDKFSIEEAFLGDMKVGEQFELPGFKLATPQMYGPDKVDPIAPATRILLFLRPKDKSPGKWEITNYGYSFFWTQDASGVGGLRETAAAVVGLRKKWETATAITDPKTRVEALWPYLWDNGVSFLHHTEKALQQSGAIAGDYIAEKFTAMTHNQRMTLLPELGVYGGERLHDALTQHLEAQQKICDDVLTLQRIELPKGWDSAPPNLKDADGELFYGLAVLGSFGKRSDLPFIRRVALWAVKNGQQQPCESALSAFRSMPEVENVSVIDAIWKRFSGAWPGRQLSPFDVTRSLSAHKFPETVPVLVQFLGLKGTVASEAQAFLTDIVGNDLGIEPGPWLEWYRQRKEGR